MIINSEGESADPSSPPSVPVEAPRPHGLLDPPLAVYTGLLSLSVPVYATRLNSKPRILHRSQYSKLSPAIHPLLQVTTLQKRRPNGQVPRDQDPSFTAPVSTFSLPPCFLFHTPSSLLFPLPLTTPLLLLLLLPDPQPLDPSNQPSPQPRIGSNIPASLSAYPSPLPYPSARNRSQSSQRRDYAKAMSFTSRYQIIPHHRCCSRL